MSNMFLGTAMTKAGGAEQSGSSSVDENKTAFSLDELDLPSNCPEIVDQDSWNLMCKMRRDKIRSEETIATLVSELAETEEVNIAVTAFPVALLLFCSYYCLFKIISSLCAIASKTPPKPPRP